MEDDTQTLAAYTFCHVEGNRSADAITALSKVQQPTEIEQSLREDYLVTNSG